MAGGKKSIDVSQRGKRERARERERERERVFSHPLRREKRVWSPVYPRGRFTSESERCVETHTGLDTHPAIVTGLHFCDNAASPLIDNLVIFFSFLFFFFLFFFFLSFYHRRKVSGSLLLSDVVSSGGQLVYKWWVFTILRVYSSNDSSFRSISRDTSV